MPRPERHGMGTRLDAKTAPPEGKVGFGYMLQGGSDASNEDPHASGPAEGEEWVDTGPHVMIFNVGAMVQGYPSQRTIRTPRSRT